MVTVKRERECTDGDREKREVMVVVVGGGGGGGVEEEGRVRKRGVRRG